MRRFAIVSKDRSARARIRREAEALGFSYDELRPEFIITYGGDGTLLHAERCFSGVPKLPLQSSETARKCLAMSAPEALDRIRRRAYRISSVHKLEVRATIPGRQPVTYLALNDVMLRNKHLEHAIRFSLAVDRRIVHPLLIGDGLVVATPFGSSAYFSSMTQCSFEKGIGIAFNNVAGAPAPLLMNEKVKIRITVLRGPVHLAADNFRAPLSLPAGTVIDLRRATRNAALLRFD